MVEGAKRVNPDGQRVLIVGGGIAGLTAAFRLKQAGVPVEVWEAEGRVGGMVGSHHEDGFTTEIGPVGVLEDTDGAVPLARELGVPVVAADPAAKRRWVVRDGHLKPLPSSPIGVFNGDHLPPWRALSGLLEPWRRVGQENDESVDAFLARRFGRGVADAFAEVALVGITAGDPRKTSVDAMFPTWRAHEKTHGSLLRGLMAQRKKAGKKPRQLHAFGRGWMGALVDGLFENTRSDVHLNRRVESLTWDGDQWLACDAQQRQASFSHVLLATSAHAAAALLREVDKPLADLLTTVRYAPMRVVGLGYRREDVPHALDGYGFLVPQQPLVRSLGVLFSSSLFPNQAPAGHVHLRVLMGGVRDLEAVKLSDDEAHAVVASDLKVTLGIHAAPVHTHQVAWREAIPQYGLGHAGWAREVQERVAGLRTLALCGGAYGGGVGVNDAVRSASSAVAPWLESRT